MLMRKMFDLVIRDIKSDSENCTKSLKETYEIIISEFNSQRGYNEFLRTDLETYDEVQKYPNVFQKALGIVPLYTEELVYCSSVVPAMCFMGTADRISRENINSSYVISEEEKNMYFNTYSNRIVLSLDDVLIILCQYLDVKIEDLRVTRRSIRLMLAFFLGHERRHVSQSKRLVMLHRNMNMADQIENDLEGYQNMPSEVDANYYGYQNMLSVM